MAGALAGATFVWLTYYDHYAASNDPGDKLATFCTAPAIRRTATNLFGEAIGTFVLVLAVLLFQQPSTGADHAPLGLGSLGALPVGLLVLAIGLSLGGTTGYAINPARDLGPRLAHALLPIAGKGETDWDYSWVPIVGPLLGGAAGALLAKAVIVG